MGIVVHKGGVASDGRSGATSVQVPEKHHPHRYHYCIFIITIIIFITTIIMTR